MVLSDFRSVSFFSFLFHLSMFPFSMFLIFHSFFVPLFLIFSYVLVELTKNTETRDVKHLSVQNTAQFKNSSVRFKLELVKKQNSVTFGPEVALTERRKGRWRVRSNTTQREEEGPPLN